MNDFTTMEGYRPYTPSTVKRARVSVDANNFNTLNDMSAVYQSPNNLAAAAAAAACKPKPFWRRSSIAYFADESESSPMKVDMSFDSNEIFRPENVLSVINSSSSRPAVGENNANTFSRRFQDQGSSMISNITSSPATFSPVVFPFTSSNKSKTMAFPHTTPIVSEGEDDARSVATTAISSPPFCSTSTSFPPPLTMSSSSPPPPPPPTMEQQYNQNQNYYSMSMSMSMTMMTMTNNNNKRKEMEQRQLSSSQSPPTVSKVRFRSHQAESWMEKYEELLDFRLKSGHCLVPNQYSENPSLAEWVKRQRYQYKLKGMGKHSSMSDDRVIALEKLGFVWNSHDAVWEERLKELKLYKNVFGNTNVPSKYEANPQLAIWIKRQRRQFKFLTESKPSTMTQSRVEKLREINFSWSGRKPKV